MLSYNENYSISQISKLRNKIKEITKKILEKAHNLKVIEEFSKDKEVDYQLLKYLFMTKSINLEEIYIKLAKEKDKFFIHIFDGNSLEEKMELVRSLISIGRMVREENKIKVRQPLSEVLIDGKSKDILLKLNINL